MRWVVFVERFCQWLPPPWQADALQLVQGVYQLEQAQGGDLCRLQHDLLAKALLSIHLQAVASYTAHGTHSIYPVVNMLCVRHFCRRQCGADQWVPEAEQPPGRAAVGHGDRAGGPPCSTAAAALAVCRLCSGEREARP